MKSVAFCLLLAFSAALPARAQLFRPEAARGAVLGGIAGAVIGHNDGRHGWEGAAYGAAAGAIIGTAIGESRDHGRFHRTQVPRPIYRHPYAVGSGRYYDRGYLPYRHSVTYGPPVYRYPAVYSSRPYHYPVYRRPSYARTGVLLGGIAGAIIGHNDGRHGWEGAAYGAGAGYLLGAIADRQAIRRQVEAEGLSAPQTYAAPAAAPQQVTIINNYYGGASTGPMSSANGLFGR